MAVSRISAMHVAICQPLIPAYRVPLFEQLGASPGIALTVFAGGSVGGLAGAELGSSFRFVSAPVRRLPFGTRVQWAQLRAAACERFDLVIAPWDAHYLSLALCIALAHGRRVPIALWGHGYSKSPDRLRGAIRNFYGKYADAVLLYSRSIADLLIKEHDFAAAQVFVAPNALDQSPIRAARKYWLEQPAALATFQSTYGLDPKQTIVFLSRLEADNRIDMLITAMDGLRRVRPLAKLVIIGDGSQRSQLARQVQTRGLGKHIIFVGALYDEIKIAPWLLSGTLFCYPTNIGLSLLHAFGYGLPVVTDDNIGAHNPEIEALSHGRNGLLYRDGDTDDMLRRWLQLLDDSPLRIRLAENAMRTVVEERTLNKMVDGFLAIFEFARQRLAGRARIPPGEP